MALKAHRLALIGAAGLLWGTTAAAAQRGTLLAPALVTVSKSNLPSTPAVDAYYERSGDAPIWFRDAATFKAAKRLPAILDRAPLDGLSDGPELARLVESAIERFEASGDAASSRAFLAEDKFLSSVWVRYVRAVRSPVVGIAYSDASLVPHAPLLNEILDDARNAASLTEHVRSVAAVNPIYARLRKAASNLARLGDGAVIDPRLAANLDRARILPAAGRYIVVNAATAQLSMYEDGKAVGSMKVIVGKPSTPTPMLAGTVHFVTLNPYWNIPTDVARRSVAPLVIKEGTKYLAAVRYEAVSDWTDKASVLDPATIDWKAVAAGNAEVYLRQLPGPGNMMGAIKVGFDNDLGIYLHDTPRKELFAEDQRNFSLGCVRLEDAPRLARWLLGREPVAPSDKPETLVKLTQGVPVFITYLTAMPKGARVTFAADVYGRDPKPGARLAEAEFATGPSAAMASARP